MEGTHGDRVVNTAFSAGGGKVSVIFALATKDGVNRRNVACFHRIREAFPVGFRLNESRQHTHDQCRGECASDCGNRESGKTFPKDPCDPARPSFVMQGDLGPDSAFKVVEAVHYRFNPELFCRFFEMPIKI